jgi:hypothetical protein
LYVVSGVCGEQTNNTNEMLRNRREQFGGRFGFDHFADTLTAHPRRRNNAAAA